MELPRLSVEEAASGEQLPGGRDLPVSEFATQIPDRLANIDGLLVGFGGRRCCRHARIADLKEVGPLALEVAEQRLDPGLVGRGPGRPKCCAMAHRAMNSGADPDVIWRPLSDTASRMGRLSSSTLGSTRPSALASTGSRRPSAARASPKMISTWVEVSSAETMSAIHLRDTRSSITVTATPARVKCDVS